MAIIVLLAFNVQAFVAGRNLLITTLLLLFFITSTTTAAYCVEKIFTQASLGQMAILLFNVIFGTITVITILILNAMFNQVKCRQKSMIIIKKPF